MEQIETEIQKTKQMLEELEKQKLATTNELDSDLLLEEIVNLESNLQNLEEIRNNLLQWNEYVKQCEHDFVLDLIDIDPDRSKVIKYCKHCLFTKDD